MIFAYATAKKFGTSFRFENWESPSHHSQNVYTWLVERFMKLPNYIHSSVNYAYKYTEPGNKFTECLDMGKEIPDLVEKEVLIAGFFQNENYFKKHSEAVKQLFSPTREFIEKAYATYPFLKDEVVTAISVRRGDYLIYSDYHPVVSKEYLDAALKKIPNSRYHLIFTDDVPWCKENLAHINNVYFVEAAVHEQMWLMSLCDNFVISNSSFSWWGAYMSRNPNKIVVAPETWYGPRGPATWKEIYCEGWIVLPTYYADGFIHPK